MVKKLIKTGIMSMAGMGIMGAMGSTPGMPNTGNLTSTVGAGLNLANVGNVARIGMNIIPKGKKGKKVTKDKWSGNKKSMSEDIISKII